jgi:hypothetical protein
MKRAKRRNIMELNSDSGIQVMLHFFYYFSIATADCCWFFHHGDVCTAGEDETPQIQEPHQGLERMDIPETCFRGVVCDYALDWLKHSNG